MQTNTSLNFYVLYITVILYNHKKKQNKETNKLLIKSGKKLDN